MCVCVLKNIQIYIYYIRLLKYKSTFCFFFVLSVHCKYIICCDLKHSQPVACCILPADYSLSNISYSSYYYFLSLSSSMNGRNVMFL